MDKMTFKTKDIANENVEKIAKLFPSVMSEGKVDFEKLRQELSNEVIDGDESYDFTWVGKKAAMVEANKTTTKTLRPCKEESVNFDTTENLYIEGDNLEVLKLLQESYLGKIKMIYIDPPYNTGNDFIYNDDFKMEADEYKDVTGEVDENENRMFKNSETNGRYHSDWCSMIYSRLKLAYNLLSDDGTIFISIDNNEVSNLKKISDEVFGENYFVSIIPRICSWQRSGQEKFMNISHDYLLCYTRSSNFHNVIERDLCNKEICCDNIGYYIKGDTKAILAAQSQGYSKGGDYDFEYNGKIYKPVDSNGNRNRWLWTKERMEKAASLGILVETSNSLRMQIYLDKKFDENTNEMVLKDEKLILHTADFMKEKFDNPIGTKELKNIFDNKEYFDNPKPIELVSKLISLSIDKDNDIVLDFFSGSATTAHAVMKLNAEDGGNRKFIMVQLPEKTDENSEAYKAGYKNICEIGKERIRRAGKKILEENKDKENIKNLDIGFRVLKLDESNMKDVYYHPEEYGQNMLDMLTSNIKEDRTEDDLLFASLIERGVMLNKSYRKLKIDNHNIIIYNEEGEVPEFIACFDENISEKACEGIAKMKPLKAVFRDSSFESSSDKINIEEIFKMHSPETKIKVM